MSVVKVSLLLGCESQMYLQSTATASVSVSVSKW